MAIGDNVPATKALQKPLLYGDDIVTLTSGMIAGTDPFVASNADRLGLKFSASLDFALSLTAAQSMGQPIYATAGHELIGPSCPMGALYLATGSGFAVDDTILVWEA